MQLRKAIEKVTNTSTNHQQRPQCRRRGYQMGRMRRQLSFGQRLRTKQALRSSNFLEQFTQDKNRYHSPDYSGCSNCTQKCSLVVRLVLLIAMACRSITLVEERLHPADRTPPSPLCFFPPPTTPRCFQSAKRLPSCGKLRIHMGSCSCVG